MGKKIRLRDPKTGKITIIDDDECTVISFENFMKSAKWAREIQYKYFCEHPEEIEDEKLFSELKEEFGNDETEEKEI